MKRFFTFMAVALISVTMTSCEFDPSDLWNEIDSLKEQVQANSEEIATLSSLIDALNNGKVIVGTEQTENGYKLKFSDGSSLEIKNGADGIDGANGDSFFVSIEETDTTVIITLADGRVITIPKVEIRVLTFEDADTKFTSYAISGCGYPIETWSDLIDDTQYGGALLYNDYSYTGYEWRDAGNTEIASGIIDGGAYWNGGHAISDYYMEDCTQATYETQLAVSTGVAGAAGHNGSKNFCVQNGYVDDKSWKTNVPSFSFADGVARVVDHMYVVPTSYVLNSLMNGDGFSTPAGDDTWYKIVATGYDANGSATGTAEFMICNGKDNIVSEWTKFDLSKLGKVIKIEFNLVGSDDLVGDYGLNCPAYFAYDDVAVRF